MSWYNSRIPTLNWQKESSGLMHRRNKSQIGIQLLAVIVTILFAFTMTYGIAKALNASVGLRVSPMEEEVGLDISSHGERSYS